MVSHEDDNDPTDTDHHTFVSRLRELKQNGSSLLIVGEVPDSAAVQACHWMLGDSSVRDRRRLFVLTAPDRPSVADRLSTSPARLRPETTRIVRWTTESRSAVTAAPARPPEPPYEEFEPVQVGSDRLAELGITVSSEIEAFEETAGGLAPSELRLCFDSLATLSAEYDHEKLFQFLHVLIGRVRSVRAMAHFHFPVTYDSTAVTELEPLFDATVELRISNGEPEQRWHLSDEDITSAWLTPSFS